VKSKDDLMTIKHYIGYLLLVKLIL